jgi:hypothetical protein
MNADDWMEMIEKKLQVVQCTNRERVLFAAHQLVGPTADWWDTYVKAHEDQKASTGKSSGTTSKLITCCLE